MNPANTTSLLHVLSLSEIGASAKQAFAVLAAYPFRWLAIVVVLLIGVESLLIQQFDVLAMHHLPGMR